MSHDQKPGRVQVMQPGDDPRRRRGDTPPVVIDGTIVAGAGPRGPAMAAGPPKPAGRGGILAIALFLIAAAGGGIGIEMLWPS